MGRGRKAVWLLGSAGLLFISALPWHDATGAAEVALRQNEFKSALRHYERALREASVEERGAILCSMARVAYRDQDQESAFAHYLQALEMAQRIPAPEVGEEEEQLYKEALALYLTSHPDNCHAVMERMRREYGPVIEIHPDFYRLKMVVATAYANCNMFEEFFARFYPAYQRYPDSFLAYKTRAVLHLKLMERARVQEEKQGHRLRALSLLQEAAYRNPGDTGLYRLITALSRESGQPRPFLECMEFMLENGVSIPRADLLTFVHEAMLCGENDLAHRIVDRGRSLYDYSRSVEVAQEYLDKRPVAN